MDVIIVIVSLIGWKVSNIDFLTLHFYITLSYSLLKALRHFTDDKTARR